MAKQTFKEHFLRVIAVVGLIAVLLLGAWGIIQLAFFIPEFLSNVAGGTAQHEAAKETLVVSIPAGIASGQTATLSWKHSDASNQYGYSVSYSCADGFSIKAPLPNNTTQNVPCNTPFNYTNATDKTSLILSNTGTQSAIITVTVSATKLSSGEVTATGSANTTVAPAKKAAAPVKTTTPAKTSYVASGRTTNLYGTPDLSVRILSNPGTVRAGAQVPLQFVIENVGTNVMPANWIFTAALPYAPVYTYQSPTQQALYPGDKIVYTLSYTATVQNDQNIVCTQQYPNYNCPTPNYGGASYDQSGWSYPYSTVNGYSGNVPYSGYGGTQSVSVTADPYNLFAETSEYNNTTSLTYSVY